MEDISGGAAMETDRFEALIDAILAIIITIIVLELPLPANGSWTALYAIRYEFAIYAVSFIVCFNFWNFNNNIFNIVNKIDANVIWITGIELFIFSLLPYLTTFVAENYYLFFPQFLYGLSFIIIAIFSIIRGDLLKRADPANIALQISLTNKPLYGTIIFVLIGMIIGYFAYPPAIIICCLLSILGIWCIPKIQYYLN